MWGLGLEVGGLRVNGSWHWWLEMTHDDLKTSADFATGSVPWLEKTHPRPLSLLRTISCRDHAPLTSETPK